MSSAAQRSELQSQIWRIANEVRGAVDGWDFKQYIKHKPDTKVQFTDASGGEFYKKETDKNVLTEEHIEAMIQVFETKEDRKHVSKIDEIIAEIEEGV